MMGGFVDLERQKTPYELITVQPGQDLQIKNGIYLRPFLTEHTAPSMGYSLIEKRSKLKPEFIDMPQEKLRELKERGTEITRTLEIPLIAYVGDTAPGPHLIRDEIRKAQIILGECTFFEPDHKDRAKIGMHMHVSDVAEWLRVLECQHLVLIHVSRRTDMQAARKHFIQTVGETLASKVHFLMDHKTNRARYDKQAFEAEALAQAHAAASGKKQYPEVEPVEEE
jgi:ribonuclease Z